MYYEISGECFREVLKVEDGSWLVSFDHPLEPRFVLSRDMENLTRILPPDEYVKNQKKEPTAGQRKRIALLEGSHGWDPECIMDRDKRNEKIRESADRTPVPHLAETANALLPGISWAALGGGTCTSA